MKKLIYILILLTTSNLYSQDLFFKTPPFPENKIDLILPSPFGDGINLKDGNWSSNEKITFVATVVILIPTTLAVVSVIKDPSFKKPLWGALAFDCVMCTLLVVTLNTH